MSDDSETMILCPECGHEGVIAKNDIELDVRSASLERYKSGNEVEHHLHLKGGDDHTVIEIEAEDYEHLEAVLSKRGGREVSATTEG